MNLSAPPLFGNRSGTRTLNELLLWPTTLPTVLFDIVPNVPTDSKFIFSKSRIQMVITSIIRWDHHILNFLCSFTTLLYSTLFLFSGTFFLSQIQTRFGAQISEKVIAYDRVFSLNVVSSVTR